MYTERKLNECTFCTTGTAYHHQFWKKCLDCFPESEQGACLNCIAVCHEGHNVEDVLRSSNFYCDCGHKGQPTCKLNNRLSHPHPNPGRFQPPSQLPWFDPSQYREPRPPGSYGGGGERRPPITPYGGCPPLAPKGGMPPSALMNIEKSTVIKPQKSVNYRFGNSRYNKSKNHHPSHTQHTEHQSQSHNRQPGNTNPWSRIVSRDNERHGYSYDRSTVNSSSGNQNDKDSFVFVYDNNDTSQGITFEGPGYQQTVSDEKFKPLNFTQSQTSAFDPF